MTIKALEKKEKIVSDQNVSKAFAQFELLLDELRKRDLPPHVVTQIDDGVDHVNTSVLSGNPLAKHIKQTQANIMKALEKELKLVPKNHYRNLWMLLGFTSFGLPIGVALGLSLGNIGLMGAGLPLGMAIGWAVGSSMDKKAEQEGRQLNFEAKY